MRERQLQDGEDEAITKCVHAMTQRHPSSTCGASNTVQRLTKRRSFTGDEHIIELQVKGRVDVAVELHSRQTVVQIIDISKMKRLQE